MNIFRFDLHFSDCYFCRIFSNINRNDATTTKKNQTPFRIVQISTSKKNLRKKNIFYKRHKLRCFILNNNKKNDQKKKNASFAGLNIPKGRIVCDLHMIYVANVESCQFINGSSSLSRQVVMPRNLHNMHPNGNQMHQTKKINKFVANARWCILWSDQVVFISEVWLDTTTTTKHIAQIFMSILHCRIRINMNLDFIATLYAFLYK